MGINLGALFGPLIAGYLAQRVDWHIGFASAGVGMALGLVQYVLGTQPSAAAADQRPARRKPRRRNADAPKPTAFTATEWKRIAAIVIFFLVGDPVLGRHTSRRDRR